MTPNFEKAALKATETLIEYNVSFAPIAPLPILKSMPDVIVLSYAETAEIMGIDRNSAICLFGNENHDAVTNLKRVDGKLRYIVSYNQILPIYLVQRSLARELGHIVLQHDGSRPQEVRYQEAICFAQHFLCPRALIKGLSDAGITITTEVVGNITGCYERCLVGMQQTPGVHLPKKLNQKVKEQFAAYIDNFVDVQRFLKGTDASMIANFGTFMDGYEE